MIELHTLIFNLVQLIVVWRIPRSNQYSTATLGQSGEKTSSADIQFGLIDSRLEDKEYPTATLGQSGDRISSPDIQ